MKDTCRVSRGPLCPALHLGGTCEHLESRIKCGRSEESGHAHLLGGAPENTYLRRGGII